MTAIGIKCTEVRKFLLEFSDEQFVTFIRKRNNNEQFKGVFQCEISEY